MIHIDIDPAEIGKVRTPDVPIVGDVRSVLKELLKHVQPRDWSAWNDQIVAWKTLFPSSVSGSNQVKGTKFL